MTPPAPLVALLAGVGAWALVTRDGSPAGVPRRLVSSTRSRADGTRSAGAPGTPAPAHLARRDRSLGALGAAALAVVLLDLAGVLLAPLVAAGTWWLLGRLEPAAVRRRRLAVVQDLPGAADLLLACVAAGAPPGHALGVVGESVEGVVGDALRRAAAAHRLGAPFADVVAAWRADPALEPLLAIGVPLARSEDTGAPLVRALRQAAADLRDRRAHRCAAAARQAGVRTAAPLGLCFLPAFVLVGLVPVVITVATSAAL